MKQKIRIPSWDDPNILQDISDELGVEVADDLAASLGGQRVYFASADKMTSESKLAQAMGFETARRICEIVAPSGAGLHLDIPNAGHNFISHRRLEALRLFQNGASCNEVANHLKITRRSAQRIKRELRQKGSL